MAICFHRLVFQKASPNTWQSFLGSGSLGQMVDRCHSNPIPWQTRQGYISVIGNLLAERASGDMKPITFRVHQSAVGSCWLSQSNYNYPVGRTGAWLLEKFPIYNLVGEHILTLSSILSHPALGQFRQTCQHLWQMPRMELCAVIKLYLLPDSNPVIVGGC